ncbi:anti-sigma regulatory factor [Clostridium sp. CX1]|uniref:anti-sigma regulatory factor n=1 Tax=Clostridium sp. CX1 TaxID=2978346 RepID=UPI0021C0077A|nr:anti-sigma regulatory factor [Clostridium sp. CX1]MCT8977391.1 anti-sigma regulatory factor [Clostridium sp. CX1]
MNSILRGEKIYITDELSIINAGHIVLSYVKKKKFSIVDQTKIITATSELTRNIIKYAGKGTVYIEHIFNSIREGLRITFEDFGPGIADINLAMRDGYSSSDGMGLGLPGTKRLMDEFQITSELGKGTKVIIVKWIS